MSASGLYEAPFTFTFRLLKEANPGLRINNNNTAFPEPLFTVLICSFSPDYQVYLARQDDRKVLFLSAASPTFYFARCRCQYSLVAPVIR